ncbi:unnamed protein product [Withania somnifera]
MDFNFDSTCTSSCKSSPSSPQQFGITFFFSAPTSPNRISSLYGETDVNYDDNVVDDDIDDFGFEFSGHEMEKSSVTAADELFDGGKIKLKPIALVESPRSPKRRLKQKKKEIEPIEEANELGTEDDRGRVRSQNSKFISSGSSRHKETRSSSPLRIADLLLINENDVNINSEKTETESSVSSLISLWNRSWKLKDLLLFRSASESRASSSTEELNKYALVKKVRQEDVKKVGSSSMRKRTGLISAHELHYKMKREVLKDMKKKTFLPYKQGLLAWHGCYGLDDTVSVYMARPQ